jgi:hypothetical protein
MRLYSQIAGRAWDVHLMTIRPCSAASPVSFYRSVLSQSINMIQSSWRGWSVKFTETKPGLAVLDKN